MQQIKRLIQQGYRSLQKNDLQQAFKSFSKAAKVDQNNFDAHFALGHLYSQKGDFESAHNHLRRAVKISPDSFAAHGQLGIALYGLQRPAEAIKSYERVLELQPENVVALANIAMTYLDLGKREEAIRYSNMAIQIKPDFSGAHALLASAYSALGKFENAVNSYDAALKLEPDNPVSIAGKVDALNKLGKRDEALDAIRPYIKAEANHPSIAITYAHVSCTLDEKGKAVNIIEQVLKASSLTHKQQLQLHFAAGDLYDSMDVYDRAFKHYDVGNQLVQRSYNRAADKKLFDDIIKVFSLKAMQKLPRAQLPQAGQQGISPVFIIGMPRSGTSLVERIIGSHSKVFPAGELNIIPQAAEKISMLTFPENVSDISKSKINNIAQECLNAMTTLAGQKELIIDKLPHNFLFLGLIELLFPDALIIHCKRNPVDTCLSNYFQYFSGPLDYPYTLRNTAIHYNHYQRLMNHWRKVIRLPMYEITYEELVQHQGAVTADILSFLNLPWQDNCVNFNESKQVTRTASYQQVMKPIYTRSIGRWQHYEKYLGELINNLSR